MNLASKVLVFFLFAVGAALAVWLTWNSLSPSSRNLSSSSSATTGDEPSKLAKLKPPTAKAQPRSNSDEEELPLLTIGSVAPELNISDWLSDGAGHFPHVQKFESNKVYVVEFWATWCGPCIMSMPHLAATQTAFLDKNVQIISVSDEDLPTIDRFLSKPVQTPSAPSSDEPVEGKEKPQTYRELTGVYCLTTDPDGSVNRDYMQAAKQNGIPTCFIVGKSGLIEWIGHPLQMDEPLTKVVNDSWDREAHLAAFLAQQEMKELVRAIENAIQEEKLDDAKKLIADGRTKFHDNPEVLEMLEDADLDLKLIPVIRHLQSEEYDDALDRIDTIAKTASPEQQYRLEIARFSIAMSRDDFKAASASIAKLLEFSQTGPILLRQIISPIANEEEPTKKFPVEFIDSIVKVAEKLVSLEPGPQSSSLLDKMTKIRSSYSADK